MDYIQDLFGVAGKTVLVTGGSRGIGEAIAEGFVRAGARVYICSRDLSASEEVATRLRNFGSCTALSCNVASAEDRQRLLERYQEFESTLHVLVNNAGAIWNAPFAEYPETGWDKVFDLNVKGTFFLIQKFAPLLAKAASHEDPARVINIGSIDAVRIAKHDTYAYAASKAAIHHMSRKIAAELAPKSITVNVIAPGLFPSRLLTSEVRRFGEAKLVEDIPLSRLVSEADMAGAAIYLASKAGAFLTGTVTTVDGGMSTTV